jgi:ubiquinone/menaquinone biosynthesis C-methylase UbiE
MSSAEGAATFRASAEMYDRHVGRYVPRLSRELVHVAGVRAGQRVLDVGCGPGGLTAAIAEVAGAHNVAAVDPSEPFVEACRRRVPGADVRVGEAESLPFADDTFDAALSQLVVNFMTDAEAGVGEMRRVTRPGGIVVSAVWDYAGEMTMLRTYWDAALALDPDAPDEGRTMRYCSPGELETLWEQAGLADVRSGELVVDAAYEDFDDYWAPLVSGVGPSGAYGAALDPERRAALREECRRRLGSPEGAFRLAARAWYVVGHVPDPGLTRV